MGGAALYALRFDVRILMGLAPEVRSIKHHSVSRTLGEQRFSAAQEAEMIWGFSPRAPPKGRKALLNLAHLGGCDQRSQ